MRNLLALLTLFVLAITGCASPESEPESVPAPTVTLTAIPEPEQTPEPIEEPTPEPKPESAALRAGDELDLESGGTVAFLDYEQPVATSGPQPTDAGYPDGLVWGAADVRVCVADVLPSEVFPDENIPPEMDQWVVSTVPWALLYDDGSVITPSSTGYTNFPQPEYPWGEYPMSPGQCVRGWIVFPVPEDAVPSEIQYAPSMTAPRTWEVE